jgi:phosphatidylinositol alpha-1,6-mannosyltransferase
MVRNTVYHNSTDKRLRVLFITRKFPPSVGGMERLSYQLIKHLRAYVDVYPIAWGYSQFFLPLFLLRALSQGLAQARSVDILYAGDPLVAPVVWIVGRLYHLPTLVTIHGLDITFNCPGYQLMTRFFLRSFTRVICISRFVYMEALKRGLNPEHCCVIYPGVEIPEELPSRTESRFFIENILGISLKNRQVWLTVGRLIPRKGVSWFCEQVLPNLPNAASFAYLIAGEGPEIRKIRVLLEKFKLHDRVYLLGRVDDAELSKLYVGSDAFIMPNIYRPHDPEGFGLVAIEAASHGLPVIAARLQGIQDAVIESKNGYLLPPNNSQAWIEFLLKCLSEPQILEKLRASARIVTAEHFSWNKIIKKYLDIFYEILQKHTLKKAYYA